MNTEQATLKNVETTVCVLPWNHLFIDNGGHSKICCLSQNLLKNSNEFEIVKEQMLKGQWPKSCGSCQQAELSTRESFRLHMNRTFAKTHQQILEENRFDQVEFVDIRLGNLCNLKCRMCSPSSSFLLGPEFATFSQQNPDILHLPADDLKKLSPDLQMIIKSTRWASVKRLHLAGGEPLISQELPGLLSALIEMNCAKQIDVTFNTNATIFNKELIPLLNEFKSVKMTVSLDGLEAVNSYIRFPSRWAVIQNNIQLFQDLSFQVAIHFTLQIYNVWDWPFFLHAFSSERKLPVYLNLLSHPNWLSVQALPPELKGKVAQHYEKFNLGPLQTLHLNSALHYMSQKDSHHSFEHFQKWTSHLDQSRHQSWSEIAPDLNQ